MGDHKAHARGLRDRDLYWLRYQRETTNKQLKRVKAPTIVIENQTAMVDAIIQEMRRRGISEKAYAKYCDEHWQEHAAREMNIEMKDKCLKWLRHMDTQAPGEFERPGCTQRNQSCGPICPEWVEATEEQQYRFLYNMDVDTGEQRPYPDLEEEE
jgi:hypothetical protein